MRGRFLLVGFVLLATGTFSVLGDETPATDVLSEVVSQLAIQQRIRGSFTQEKHLHFMQKPFISHGEFSLGRDDGLRWQVTEPLPSLMTVQGAVVSLDGKPVNDRGVGRLIAGIMLGFMQGDLSGLAAEFEISGEASASGWFLTLVPRGGGVASVLSRIELSGDQYLHSVEVIERNTTRTRTIFSNVVKSGNEGVAPSADSH